jgi:hypothetical protein
VETEAVGQAARGCVVGVSGDEVRFDMAQILAGEI